MANNNDILEDDDFEKLLDSFINDNTDDIEEDVDGNVSDRINKLKNPEPEIEPEETNDDILRDEDMLIPLDDDDKVINAQMTGEDLDQALISSLQDAKIEAQDVKEQPALGSDESELAQAFLNFYNSVNKLSNTLLKKPYECNFEVDDLYPNYKPSTGQILSNDLVHGWVLLVYMFPNELGKFSPSSSDEEFLNLAEKISNSDLQLAIISYVEILIDIESCELSYQAKLIQHQEKYIKRLMYEEYLARKERQRKFTEALAKKNFPVDADRLISNYFRVAQKDVDGAYKALTTNPAIFAPIDFSKIKPRFFGLLKVTPKDGIRINLEIGNFLKKLKV